MPYALFSSFIELILHITFNILPLQIANCITYYIIVTASIMNITQAGVTYGMYKYKLATVCVHNLSVMNNVKRLVQSFGIMIDIKRNTIEVTLTG